MKVNTSLTLLSKRFTDCLRSVPTKYISDIKTTILEWKREQDINPKVFKRSNGPILLEFNSSSK